MIIRSATLIADGYHYLAGACDVLDVQVLGDIAGDEMKPCFALGQSQELAAGLRRMEITPYFDSLKELDEWCGNHKSELNALAESDTLYALDAEGRRV